MQSCNWLYVINHFYLLDKFDLLAGILKRVVVLIKFIFSCNIGVGLSKRSLIHA